MTDKKILYIDLDNTLVDFSARLEGIYPDVLAQYVDANGQPNYDEIPGVFALMPPMPGAIEAFKELAELFDVYILSTAPWENPSAWQHKIEWVHLHLGRGPESPAYKRLILSHHKNLNEGDFLIDDRRDHNGAGDFVGELIWFGQGEFETWSQVVDYLRPLANTPRALRSGDTSRRYFDVSAALMRLTSRSSELDTVPPGADHRRTAPQPPEGAGASSDDAFANAMDALEASEAYPMLSPEHRAAAQRALQEFKRAAAESGTTLEGSEHAAVADRLAAYLAVDWSQIDVVEVRYRDGSTEVVDLRGDQRGTDRLYGVMAFRVIEARDGEDGETE
ncbi:5' nucleotidase, NT5C type [Demequina rhizosphaerae]|uniref:5' nucleotidase, NT5C type n=1 Tax=Demequina rhizosphaerae TaxID=1638985 RepID=UPI000A07CCEC|nr:hypothetical protein [Demequina rhizosphaerae]